ncbi:sensor histidine kinase [Psychrobacillus sp.]|uniref:sensor histidine kinase n=1 Tax=Psychrobacillus sp. TaxID=1871623 RepID=UPI0028BEC9D7|nr:sensor histidine kinase [Psychrobacillus sp.]
MLLLFLKERKAWIFFFILLQIWININLTLDIALSHVSVLYINAVNGILFLVFLIWRFFKETSYMRKLKVLHEQEKDIFIFGESIPEGTSPFEQKITCALEVVVIKSREELNLTKVQFSEEYDDTLAWIHEIKTPLTAMKLMIDTIENPILRKKVELNWLRVHLLLDQQLHQTRLPTMEKDNRIEPVILQNVIHKEIRELQVWCMEKKIGFDLENLEEVVLTDQKWLSFIVRQLLSNAVKYSEEDNEIRIHVAQDEIGHILLHVKDEGVGITKADLPRIFDKSFTGSTGRLGTASTGMGLYLAKNAAEKLGISIDVQSEVNVGTVFSLKFPLKNEFVQITSR